MAPWEGFIRRYAEFGRNPSVKSYVELFDPEGTLLHPGMTTPIGRDKLPDFAARAFANLREFRLEPVRWGGRDNTVFVEARNSATVADKRISWPALYCVELRDERVLRGRAYYDRAAVLLHWETLADPVPDAHSRVLEAGWSGGDGMPGPADAVALKEFARAYVEHWKRPDPARFPLFYHRDGHLINPELPHPLKREEMASYYAQMMTQIPGLRCRLQNWALGGRFLFFEWSATGSVGGKWFELGMAERLTMDGALARESVGYFDSLGIHDLLDPETALRATVASGAGAGV